MFFFFFFFPNVFSERLAHTMENKNMDADTLAILASVSPITVQRWLKGEYNPRYINLTKVTQVLNVSADYLCGISD